MLSYALRWLAAHHPRAAGVAALVFLLLHFVPGDPAVSMLGEGARAEDVEALPAKLGLDRPILAQYSSALC